MSQTLVRPEAGAVVEVHDLRGAAAPSTAPPVLHDPSGRRADRIRAGARAVVGLLLAWVAGLLLAGLGLLPAAIIPFGFLVSAPAPAPLVAMTGAQSASDGRPGATSAVGIVLSTAVAISANDFAPLAPRELDALGVVQRRGRSAPVDPRGTRSPGPASSPAGIAPVDQTSRGHGRATDAVQTPAASTTRPGDTAPAPATAERPTAKRPAGGDTKDKGGDPPSRAGSTGNANGGTSNAGGNANGGTSNAGGNANPGGTSNAGGNANPGSSGNAHGDSNAGGKGSADVGVGNAGASTGPGGADGPSNASGNANAGSAHAGAKGGGNGDASPSNAGTGNPGGTGNDKPRGRDAAS